ncbi:MAG: AlpA family transcriptional regulator [Pseudomonadota bacterium]|nr:AlpA family transcriptional regulator [Pseudomonadota bacterium]
MESEVKQLLQTSNALPLPGTEAYELLPRFPKRSPLPFRRTVRRQELRLIVPLAETTIYEMERRGASKPDVHLRKTRPVRAGSSEA